MNLLLGAMTGGLQLALLSLGVFLSFRVLRSLDLTTDGAFNTGSAVAVALVVAGWPPLLATAAGGLAGAAAGALTGLIHTRWRVDVVLAGILVTSGLYSVHLWIMGSGNLPLAGRSSLFDQVVALLPGTGAEGLSGEVVTLAVLILLVGGIGLLLALFTITDLGLALRATGSNPRMAKASGIDTGLTTTLGLALANGCTGLSGALVAQYGGFANLQTGIGMIVTGLASVILGEALFSGRTIRRRIWATIFGAVVFKLLLAAALTAGLDPTALKLVTALFVLAALTLPPLLRPIGLGWLRRVRDV